MYDNCKIVSPNGTGLSFCDRKRFDWYLKKGLATKISDQPPVIKLTFNPDIKLVNDYALCKKENKCVVCGSMELDILTKHHVIPYSYRKLFPPEIKEHNCHDVVLLCLECHRQYELIANEYKLKLCDDYGVDINRVKSKAILYRKAVNIAKRHIEGLPVNSYLSAMLYLGKSELDETDFYSILAENKPQLKGVDLCFGSELVYDRVTDIDDFIQKWRQHFVDTMNPKYLPEDWSVNYAN